MYLEAVTVCVDYADFLKEIIPWNQHLFDRWAIVTTPADEETRELAAAMASSAIPLTSFTASETSSIRAGELPSAWTT